jgi:hypothetical protein
MMFARGEAETGRCRARSSRTLIDDRERRRADSHRAHDPKCQADDAADRAVGRRVVLPVRCGARVLGSGRIGRAGVIRRRGAGRPAARRLRCLRAVGVAFSLLLTAVVIVVVWTARCGSRLARIGAWAIGVGGAGLLVRGVALELLLAADTAGIRAAVGPLETRWSLILWNTWFVLGGSGATHQQHRRLGSGSPSATRRDLAHRARLSCVKRCVACAPGLRCWWTVCGARSAGVASGSWSARGSARSCPGR